MSYLNLTLIINRYNNNMRIPVISIVEQIKSVSSVHYRNALKKDAVDMYNKLERIDKYVKSE